MQKQQHHDQNTYTKHQTENTAVKQNGIKHALLKAVAFLTHLCRKKKKKKKK